MNLKAFKPLLFTTLILTTCLAQAENPPRYDPAKEAVDIFVDLVLVRPISLAATVAGTGIFLGLSPFAGLATIAPPHDAIIRAGNAFVGLPACYAFKRPLGDLSGGQYSFRPDGQPNFCTW